MKDWKDRLLKSANGAPKPLYANAVIALREASAWQNVIAFNEFAGEVYLVDYPPWDPKLGERPARRWGPHDDMQATEWLQRENIGVNIATTAQAVESVARERTFHPVIDYLQSLEWDGEPRLSTWLMYYLGAECSVYHAYVGKLMMIGAVARIFQPGCKVDNVPILEGEQGARKSTAVRTLFEPWFTDEIADIGSKDAAMQTRGVWCVELAELDAMSRMEVSRIKAFITRTTDRFRPPYGARMIESPRSCVFWGTTNTDTYLKDETGGRRFWPIKTGQTGGIDIEGLADVADHLWAEARVLYEKGEPWWIEKSEVREAVQTVQAARYVGDAWDGPIGRYIKDEPEFTVEDVLKFALGIETSRHTQADANRVARCLRVLGCHRFQARTGDRRVWKYRQVVTERSQASASEFVTTSRLVTENQLVTRETLVPQALSPLSPLSPVDQDFG